MKPAIKFLGTTPKQLEDIADDDFIPYMLYRYDMFETFLNEEGLRDAIKQLHVTYQEDHVQRLSKDKRWWVMALYLLKYMTYALPEPEEESEPYFLYETLDYMIQQVPVNDIDTLEAEANRLMSIYYYHISPTFSLRPRYMFQHVTEDEVRNLRILLGIAYYQHEDAWRSLLLDVYAEVLEGEDDLLYDEITPINALYTQRAFMDKRDNFIEQVVVLLSSVVGAYAEKTTQTSREQLQTIISYALSTGLPDIEQQDKEKTEHLTRVLVDITYKALGRNE